MEAEVRNYGLSVNTSRCKELACNDVPMVKFNNGDKYKGGEKANISDDIFSR